MRLQQDCMSSKTAVTGMELIKIEFQLYSYILYLIFKLHSKPDKHKTNPLLIRKATLSSFWDIKMVLVEISKSPLMSGIRLLLPQLPFAVCLPHAAILPPVSTFLNTKIWSL